MFCDIAIMFFCSHTLTVPIAYVQLNSTKPIPMQIKGGSNLLMLSSKQFHMRKME